MTTSFKRTAMAGFTLIELLIVVIILAIISAIAIPQFSSATSDAQQAALDANLATVRNSLEQYRAQHTGNVYPGANAATAGTACTQAPPAPEGGVAAGTAGAMLNQLRYPTNAAGETCAVGDATNFRFGPYLRQGLPMEPITNSNAVVVTTAGTPIAPAAATGGWAYDTRSGQFIMNSNAEFNENPYSER